MRTLIPGSVNEESNQYEKIAKRLLKKGTSLYVVNQSMPRDIIFISYTDEGGETRHKNFPDSYLPVCITDAIPAESLLKSNDFWAYIRAGVLQPMKPKQAKSILAQPESEDERDRLKSRQGRSTNKVGRTIKGFKNVPSGQIKEDRIHPDGDDDEDWEEPELNKRMQHLMGRLAVDKRTTPGMVLAELRSLSLTRQDLGFLVGNGTVLEDPNDPSNRSTDNRITEWAMQELQDAELNKRG